MARNFGILLLLMTGAIAGRIEGLDRPQARTAVRAVLRQAGSGCRNVVPVPAEPEGCRSTRENGAEFLPVAEDKETLRLPPF